MRRTFIALVALAFALPTWAADARTCGKTVLNPATGKLDCIGSDTVAGASTLTTQYAVPYVSSSGVLANGPLLFQCSSGVVGIGGCTSSYPGFKVSGGTLYLKLADDSSAASTIAGNINVQGRIYSAVQTVTYSATPTFSAALYNNFKLTLTGNVTSSTLSGETAGQTITFLILENATGGNAFVWPPEMKGGMSINTAANAWNLQEFWCDGTYCYAKSEGQSGT
ncbi:MAG: hypothetical protein ABFD89_00770 [Bryobacteraceae bacterium]